MRLRLVLLASFLGCSSEAARPDASLAPFVSALSRARGRLPLCVGGMASSGARRGQLDSTPSLLEMRLESGSQYSSTSSGDSGVLK
uniref:Putative secreted protein n=1 Tax=Ixodes ricinus TaxID=34613 RepID=A0A6B0TYV6_IXORI